MCATSIRIVLGLWCDGMQMYVCIGVCMHVCNVNVCILMYVYVSGLRVHY